MNTDHDGAVEEAVPDEATEAPDHEGGHQPNILTLWQQRGKAGIINAFVYTAMLVMRRNGRLGDHLDMPLDYSSAKRFRWVALLLLIILPGITILAVLGLAQLGMGSRELRYLSGLPEWLVVVSPLVIVLLTAVQWGLWTGMVSWFFASRKLDPQRRHRAATIAYYLSAPLVILVVPTALNLLELTSTAAGQQDRHELNLSPAATIISLCVMVYWLQMILFAARNVVGRRAWGLVATGLGLPLLWALTFIMVWLAPWGVFMWLTMRYSLSF